MRLHIGEGTAEQPGHPLDGETLGDIDELAAAGKAFSRQTFGILVGPHGPLRSSTARLTMFSDAISSISSRWRPSSSAIASAISGSLSASEAENRPSSAVLALWDNDILVPHRNGSLSAGDTPRNRIIPADGRKAWDISADNALHLGTEPCSVTLRCER